MPIAKRSSVLFACALALAATALAARADDVLVLKNAGDAKEQTLAGKIHTIGPDAVQIAVDGGESKTVPADAVAWLQFEKEPLAFAAVRGEIENAQYDAALEKLADVGADELDRKAPPADFRKDFDWLKARATALKALDADDKSALADAAKLLTAFVRAAPDSPYLYEAQALVGEVALRLGRPDAATAA
ncbi:MAG: hypothetical protein HUK22_04140, partial [Thermoguttaceae bacterium]|nr:hypothetical protein [Thermoguttaceae bacterium]